jgi:hypothetical protein
MRFRATLASVVWIVLAPLALLVATTAFEPDATAAEKAVRESFKFDADEDLVTVPVRLGARDYRLLLDTGSSEALVDSLLRLYLGPSAGTERAPTPSGGVCEITQYSLPDAHVGSLPLTGERCGCYDFTATREASGCSFDGLLGMDFLRNWIITIDFDEGRVDFLGPETTSVPGWGECIPVAFDSHGIMCVLATVGKDIQIPFRVDTGMNSSGLLDSALFSRLVRCHELRATGDRKFLELSGIGSEQFGTISHFSLGSFRHQNLRMGSSSQNVIGLGYLSRFRVTIDFPHGQLYLAKGRQFAAPDCGDTCGLAFRFKTGRVEVVFVDQKSPAHSAGAQAGDVIEKVNGKPVSKLKPSEIKRLVTTEGKAVRMIVKRGEKRAAISFTPKEYD